MLATQKVHYAGKLRVHCQSAPGMLAVMFILTTSLNASPQVQKYPNAQLLLETQELVGRLTDSHLRLLDARPPEEYRLGHLPGAVNLPAPATDSLEANRRGLPLPLDRAKELFQNAGLSGSSHVVVYDEQGNRFAARVFYVLEFFGQSHVQVLNGGIGKWRAEGRPLTTEVPKVALGDFAPQAHSALMATSDWVNSHLKDTSTILVDARTPEEFRGERVQGPRGGCIPGAVNIEWTRAITPGETKTFLEPGDMRKLFLDAHVTPDREVVCYCQIGMRAAAIYFALRLLGYERVRLYDGSWQDWSAVASLPVEK